MTRWKHALLAGLLVACTGTDTDSDTDVDTDTDTDTEDIAENEEVTLRTTLGDIGIDVLEEESPDTAANFLSYASAGYYDGGDGGRATLVHNVQAPLLFEAGVYETNLAEKAVNAPVANESEGGPRHLRGTIAAMKAQSDPSGHAAGFFINAQDNTYLDGDGTTVFGEVVRGMDVVDAIIASDLESRGGFDAIPTPEVVLEEVIVR